MSTLLTVQICLCGMLSIGMIFLLWEVAKENRGNPLRKILWSLFFTFIAILIALAIIHGTAAIANA